MPTRAHPTPRWPILVGTQWARRPIAHPFSANCKPLTRTFAVETMGLEPTTPCLQSRCSSQLSYVPLTLFPSALVPWPAPLPDSSPSVRRVVMRRCGP